MRMQARWHRRSRKLALAAVQQLHFDGHPRSVEVEGRSSMTHTRFFLCSNGYLFRV